MSKGLIDEREARAESRWVEYSVGTKTRSKRIEQGFYAGYAAGMRDMSFDIQKRMDDERVSTYMAAKKVWERAGITE